MYIFVSFNHGLFSIAVGVSKALKKYHRKNLF